MPIEITMPRLSDTMESGTVIKWNVSEGDEVSSGDVIADIETDKATMEMQVFDDGTIAQILASEGDTVDIGTVIALLAEEDDDVDEVKGKAASNGKKSTQSDDDNGEVDTSKSASADDDTQGTKSATGADTSSKPIRDTATTQRERRDSVGDDTRTGGRGGRLLITPVARRMADEHDIDVHQLNGSGPSGRIIKRDVQQAIDAGEETRAAVAPGAQQMTRAEPAVVEATRVEAQQTAELATTEWGLQDQIVPLSNMRQTIAKRLIESKTTVPHYQVTVTFNADPLLKLRKDLNAKLEKQGVKLSVNDFLVRAAALSMYEHPEFNASWNEDSIRIHGRVNIGVAVSLPRERGGGLVVATLHDADRRSLREISHETKLLAEKARTKGLTIEEMSDSTFTISNLGMFGVDNFTAIINPPNSAILAVGAAVEKPVVRDGELTVGHEISATLSNDHRVIDGAMAARYLQTMREYIENPEMMLV